MTDVRNFSHFLSRQKNFRYTDAKHNRGSDRGEREEGNKIVGGHSETFDETRSPPSLSGRGEGLDK